MTPPCCWPKVSAGSEEAFARLMTQKARQLGMNSTVFRNASGLPNSEQVTTARDLTKLANALMRDYPHYYAIFSVQSYAYRGRTLTNHNRMLGNYDGADGLKTGYTNASGFNLVMSAVRDNRRLIGVVMGGTSAAQRDRTMADLMDRGFALAAAMQLSPWTSVRKPPSARYTAAQFDPGSSFAEAYRPPAAPSKQVSPKYAGFVPPAPATPATAAAFAAVPPAPPRPCVGHAFSRKLGDPGRLVQRTPGRPGSAGARDCGAAERALGLGDRRRGADGEPRVPSGAAHQPVTGTGHRRLQTPREAESLLLGAPGHSLEYAGCTLRARRSRSTNDRL